MNTTMWLSFVAVASVLAVMACDTVPLTSPTGSTISLSIDRTVLPLNGQATLRAVVTESAGTPVHNGTMVTFQPAIGTTSPVDAPTVNGIATVTFLAGSVSGKGFIHAFSGPARTGSGNSSSGGIEVFIGAAAAGSISVSASPSSVSQSGGTVTISALVLDSSNNPLPGVSVLFTAGSGTLSATTSVSDSGGIARTQLTTTQTSTVTAIAGSAKGDTTVTVSAAPTVTIENDGVAVVGVPEPITVTAAAGANNSSPRQIETVTIEFGDGTVETRNNVTGPVAFTHVYGRDGGYTIVARAVDVNGNTGVASKALVVSRSQPTATLTAPASVDMSDTGGVAGFTIAASSAVGQPPVQSVVVRLGDGTVIYSASSGGSFTYQFGATGTYAVNATVTDQAGGVATSSAVVRVVP
jgi:adhesin/invasin